MLDHPPCHAAIGRIHCYTGIRGLGQEIWLDNRYMEVEILNKCLILQATPSFLNMSMPSTNAICHTAKHMPSLDTNRLQSFLHENNATCQSRVPLLLENFK